MFFSTDSKYVELARLRQYGPEGQYFRIVGDKGIKFSLKEAELMAFHAQNKLHNVEWQNIGARVHFASDFFARTSPSPGVEVCNFFINRNGNLSPGNPKLLLNVDQWVNFFEGLAKMHIFLNDGRDISPCFTNNDYFDDEQEFIGCEICLPFQGKYPTSAVSAQ